MKTVSCWMLVFCLFAQVWAEPPETVDIRFQALRLGEDVPGTLFLQAGGEWVAVDVVRDHFQHAARYLGPNPLRLFRQVRDGEETRYEAVAEVTLPVARGDMILLLRPMEAGLRMEAVGMDEGLPAGSFLFLNQTRQRIQLRLGDKDLTVESGGQVASRPADLARGVIPFAWRIPDAPASPDNSAMDSSWFYNPERWYFVIFEEADKTISVRSVTRFPADTE